MIGRKLFLLVIILSCMAMIFFFGSATGDSQTEPEIDSLWGKLVGTKGSQGEIKGVSGYDFGTTGFIMGYDLELNDNLLAGISIGYFTTSVNPDLSGGYIDIDTYSAGFYGSYNKKQSDAPLLFYIDAGIMYNYSKIDSRRGGNLVSGYIYGDTEANMLSIAAEFGLNIPLYNKKFVLSPIIGFQASLGHVDGYQERGDSYLMYIEGTRNKLFSSTAGLRYNYAINEKFFLKADMLWAHEFSGDLHKTVINRGELGDSEKTYYLEPSKGLEVGRDSAIIGVGLDVRKTDDLSFSIDYDVGLGDHFISHTGEILCRYKL